jgi:hypothetical protein
VTDFLEPSDPGQAPASSKTASLAVAGVAMAALAAGGRKAVQQGGFSLRAWKQSKSCSRMYIYIYLYLYIYVYIYNIRIYIIYVYI